MIVLMLFAVVAGAATALSPCVLPVLPVALSAGITGGRRRPLGVVTGLALSFTFATVALVYVISALGLPDDLLRKAAILVLIGFGITLLAPPLSARLEAWLSRLVPLRPRAAGDGFGSGLIVGLGLGLVYAPCAGPILAGVITISASQSLTAGRLLVALSYGVGSAAVLYALMLGGRRLTRPLAARSGGFQIAMGAVMVVLALAMLGNYDTRFETSIAGDLPAALVNPSRSLETSRASAERIARLRGRGVPVDHSVAATPAGSSLPVLARAPAFTGTQQWFNTPGDRPLTLAGLRGRVVLVDFWTYSCINCIRTLPYLKAWDARYRAKGLTIVGVHSPEFPFERTAANVRAAIRQNGLRYPVAQDNDLATWDAYSNQYWPAEYLIDARGRVRAVDFGEGDYARKEAAIRSLLAERGATGLGAGVDRQVRAVAPSATTGSPESYLGAERGERFVNGPITAGTHDYGTSTQAPPLNALRYSGVWAVTPLKVTAGIGAALQMTFDARRVYVVLGAPGGRTASVLLDGRPVTAAQAGADVHDGRVAIGFQRLYRLIDLPRVERHTLTVIPQPGVEGYALTFG